VKQHEHSMTIPIQPSAYATQWAAEDRRAAERRRYLAINRAVRERALELETATWDTREYVDRVPVAQRQRVTLWDVAVALFGVLRLAGR
jgi:hypothetical protein